MNVLTKFLALQVLFIPFALAAEFDHDHKIFNALLEKTVEPSGNSSLVRYSKIKARPALLRSYLQSLETVKEREFKAWKKEDQLAFLINAYNAYTLKLIIDHYPVGSIKDIGGFFSSPWKKEFFSLFGKKAHLDHIEHGLIRKNYDEPRIHFALVCAAKSCPKLRPYAYRGEKLDAQLEKSAKEFLNDSARNYYNKDQNILNLSSIFKWYGEDFGSSEGLKKFVAKRMEINKDLSKSQIKYLEYDWSLNDYKKRSK